MLNLALIGHPVSHSLSTVLFDELSQILDLEIQHEKIDVAPENLPQFLSSLRKDNLDGLNVTIPHKEQVLEFPDRLESSAQELGAVNCLYRRGKDWMGTNTDWQGFKIMLDVNGVDIPKYKWVVLGAGGAARSVVYALYQAGVRNLALINRSTAKPEKLIRDFQVFAKDLKIQFSTDVNTLATDFSIAWVNTTPLGMPPFEGQSPLPAQALESQHLMVDTVYIPEHTKFLINGISKGAIGMNGLDMFIYQGLISLEKWTGIHLANKINRQHIRTIKDKIAC